MPISSKKAKARHPNSLANLRGVAGRNHEPRPSRLKPKPSPSLVSLFVRLLAAGLNLSDALAYIAPDYHASLTSKPLSQWINEWCSLPAVVDAIDAANHGAWHELSKDARIELARDHHYAQLAYFLQTSDYLSPDADLGRIRDARKALSEYLAESKGASSDIYAKALRDILDGKVKAGPPQLAAVPAPKIKAKDDDGNSLH